MITDDQALEILRLADRAKSSLDGLPDWASEAVSDIYDVEAAFSSLVDALEPLRDRRREIYERRMRACELGGTLDAWLDAFEGARGRPVRYVADAGELLPGHTIISDGQAAVAMRGEVSLDRLARYGTGPTLETLRGALEGPRPRTFRGTLLWSSLADIGVDRTYARLSVGQGGIAVNLALVREWVVGIAEDDVPITVEFDAFDPVGTNWPIRCVTGRGVAWVMPLRLDPGERVEADVRVELEPIAGEVGG